MEVDEEAITAVLRGAGACFAFVHGSRAKGSPRPESDLDVGAWWGRDAPAPLQVQMPGYVDLTVLDAAPLWLAGRIALGGRLLFDDDPPARVRWVADTRLRYLDAAEGWPVADSNGDAVRQLGQHGVIEPVLARALAAAVGFRNVLVHEYVDVDDELTVARLNELDDLRQFTRQVAAWLVADGR